MAERQKQFQRFQPEFRISVAKNNTIFTKNLLQNIAEVN